MSLHYKHRADDMCVCRYVEGNPSLVLPPEVAAMSCLAHSKGYAEGFKAEMSTYK